MVGGPVFAILIGMVIALWWKQPARGTVQDGIGFTAKKVLQYAVILLGFGLNLAQIAAVGAESLPIILTTIATALIVGYILYRVLSRGFRHRHAHRRGLLHLRRVGHRRHGAGHPRQGRAGGPGHLGHLPVQRGSGAHLPHPGAGMLGMSNEGFGLFAGTAVNDTSSVTAAAAAWDGMHPGSNALDDATIVKLTRTLAIIPITLVLGHRHGSQGERSRRRCGCGRTLAPTAWQ